MFGIAHVVLLYSGDIIGSYGVFALLFAGVVTWSSGRLWTVFAVTLAFGIAAATALQLVTADAPLAVGPTLLDSMVLRTSALAVLPLAGLSVAPAVLIGVWAGRMRLLEQPARFRRLLTRVVLVGFPIAVLGAQPVALQAVGVDPGLGHSRRTGRGDVRGDRGRRGWPTWPRSPSSRTGSVSGADRSRTRWSPAVAGR